MSRIWLLGFIFVSLSSCGTYRYNGYSTNVNVIPNDNSQYLYNYWWNVYPNYTWWSGPVYYRPILRPQVRTEVLSRPRRRIQQPIRGRRNEINANHSRGQRSSESRNNGWRSGSRENVSPKPTVPRQPRTVQPRQVRGRSGSSVLQQSRSSQHSSQQRRSRSSGRQN